MPLALLVIGLVFLIAAIRGNKCNGQQCADMLFQTLKSDFTGPDNFIYWGLALFIIGAAGYYKPLKSLSNAFLLLVILVLFLSNRGFFVRFMEQIGSTQTTTNTDLGSGLFNILTGQNQSGSSNPNKVGGSGGVAGTGLLSNKSGIGVVTNIFKGIF